MKVRTVSEVLLYIASRLRKQQTYRMLRSLGIVNYIKTVGRTLVALPSCLTFFIFFVFLV